MVSALRYVVGRLAGALKHFPVGSGIGQAAAGVARRVVLSGVGVTGPFIVTFAVLGFVLDFVAGALAPFVAVLDVLGVTAGLSPASSRMLAVGLIAGVVVLAGLLTETGPETPIGPRMAGAVESIPAVGSVYTSFDRMAEVLLDADADSFQEVKLVEFPQDRTYALAFVTSEGPTAVATAVDEREMQVLFVPMAPNPVMGGHMLCVPTDRVIDVDMSVQAAFQAIVTSGVAVGDPEEVDELPELTE